MCLLGVRLDWTDHAISALGKSRGLIPWNLSSLIDMFADVPQSPEHPLGPSDELWASILDGLRADRPQFVHESLPGIFALQAGNELSTKTLERFEHIIAEADGIALEKTCTLINQKTMDKELRELAAIPEAKRPAVMILHGDADQGMPLEASSKIVEEMLPWTELKVYEKAGHGTCQSSFLA